MAFFADSAVSALIVVINITQLRDAQMLHTGHSLGGPTRAWTYRRRSCALLRPAEPIARVSRANGGDDRSATPATRSAPEMCAACPWTTRSIARGEPHLNAPPLGDGTQRPSTRNRRARSWPERMCLVNMKQRLRAGRNGASVHGAHARVLSSKVLTTGRGEKTPSTNQLSGAKPGVRSRPAVEPTRVWLPIIRCSWAGVEAWYHKNRGCCTDESEAFIAAGVPPEAFWVASRGWRPSCCLLWMPANGA